MKKPFFKYSLSKTILWLIASVCLLTYGTSLRASAWPREKGTTFLSFSIQPTLDGPDFGTYSTLYLEHGLSDKLTFGFDGGRNIATDEITAIAFLRYPLDLSSGTNKFAFELGVGWTDHTRGDSATLRPGLSWGRPINMPSLQGWMGIDSSLAFYENGEDLVKIDGTFGVNHDNGALTMIQLQYSNPSNNISTLVVAPSYVFPLSETSRFEVGLSYETRRAVAAIKIGMWKTF
ncbi:MAG: hypothetical protein ACU0FH_00175 [Heliomarina sp.]|uniref:hypothetical protein n=1 Tax=Heliomarina sp. TaxID=2917556 RepID=UPI004058B3D1